MNDKYALIVGTDIQSGLPRLEIDITSMCCSSVVYSLQFPH
jgi:hypothetical protein